TCARGTPPSQCPAGGGRATAAAGPPRAVAALPRVYSTMSRRRTRIGAHDDDRDRVRFDTALSASFPGAVPLQRWSVVGTGFGMSMDRRTALTRLDVIRPHQVTDNTRLHGKDTTPTGTLNC